jgi:antitoxin (DNA-binding transcriptional repressor) of toxin-antitoxin stability system
MKSLSLSKFKARCIAELKALQESGEELIVTLRGEPLARVVPICGAQRELGGQVGKMLIRGDLLSSDLDDDFTEAEAKRVSRRRRA